ncbi:ribonuclease M5 [Megasphaera vaginalis (ex Bordigoni et al. 2020)]|uniref:ribonuclease M5 n=1 Tax=Megasphaera vaginalis (ex Bordigoni et al. 2020) TaxID=2045301 RepID=UPI000C79C439|nr:ribonuclease M5 [Megasphaera vaginalis (ex Bordigoni et al. 2020)]
MIREVVIVEGRADEARIRSARIDVDTIRTDGFSLRADTLRQIEYAYKRRGIIILTDPDRAGEEIRRALSKRFPRAKHAFIPRKDAIANNDLGVEQASPEAIRSALDKCRCAVMTVNETFTADDLLSAGLNGTTAAAEKRAALGAVLGIGYGNAKQFLKRLNHYGVTREEWDAALRQLQKDGGDEKF